ncbi:MAG: hypothetical protein ACYC25_13170 [Paludibacter sp.]
MIVEIEYDNSSFLIVDTKVKLKIESTTIQALYFKSLAAAHPDSLRVKIW